MYVLNCNKRCKFCNKLNLIRNRSITNFPKFYIDALYFSVILPYLVNSPQAVQGHKRKGWQGFENNNDRQSSSDCLLSPVFSTFSSYSLSLSSSSPFKLLLCTSSLSLFPRDISFGFYCWCYCSLSCSFFFRFSYSSIL